MAASTSSHDVDLAAIHRSASLYAILAGCYLRDQALLRTSRTSSSSNQLEVSIKAHSADIVTAADLHAEALITQAIEKDWPGHEWIGEESYEASTKPGERQYKVGQGPTWVIDPLDGTVNYAHGFPNCCVSVGFCLDGKPVAGAIFAPLLGGLHPTNATGTLYSAFAGGGSWSTPISFPFDPSALEAPSSSSTDASEQAEKPRPWAHAVQLPYFPPAPLPEEAPKNCLFLAEWGKSRSLSPSSTGPPLLQLKINSMLSMAAATTSTGPTGHPGGMVHGVRSLGSAALDMAYIATGGADIFWEAGCWEWDVCAGWIIILEAGGFIAPASAPEGLEDEGTIPEPGLGGRQYLAIRPAGEKEGETAKQAQERVVREVWKRVERLDYSRPGA